MAPDPVGSPPVTTGGLGVPADMPKVTPRHLRVVSVSGRVNNGGATEFYVLLRSLFT